MFLAKHLISRLLHSYADFRVSPTNLEKRCYKQSDSILLTFDDYGTKQEICQILDILKAKKVKAVFFIQGDWAAENSDLVRLINQSGHMLGNHTFSHAVLRGLPEYKIIDEINGGLPGPWMRPPEGRYDKRVRNIAANLGFSICYWSIDSRDWTGKSVEEMRYIILSELRPAAVILFHIHGEHTRELLPGLIDDIRKRGFELTAPDELWIPTSTT